MNLRLPRTVRSIRRVQTIARVLTHHGFGHLVDVFHLDRYAPLPKRWRRRPPSALSPDAEASLGRRLVRVCEELGPTFIKFGQLMSTRPDLLPADIVAELVHLQDDVPPFDTAEARRIIASDLGAPVEASFATFDAAPFASGSIAQVYHATTPAADGEPSRRVVVKVRRPDIEEVVRLDMNILRWLAELSERLLPELSIYQPRTIVDEFETTMLREMDFINEAATVGRFADAFETSEGLRVPRVHWELTGPRVLTLEELPGVSAQKLLGRETPGIDRKLLAERIAGGFVKQFFEIGLFHADPHPGNLLIEPPATVGLIDFGLTGRFDDAMLGHLVIALTAAFNREAEVIVEVLADMNALGEATDRGQLRRELLQLVDKYYGLPLHRFDLQNLFYEVTSLLRRNDVKLPREFVLFGKAIVTVGGICLQLDPHMDLLVLVKPQLRRLIGERLSPGRLAKSATISAWHVFNILKNAPSQVRDISRRLARGQWQVNIKHQNLETLATEIDHASNRLAFAVIIASVIVGSSWVLSTNSSLKFFGLIIPLPVLGVIGYLVAGVMGLGLVIAIWRSGKLS